MAENEDQAHYFANVANIDAAVGMQQMMGLTYPIDTLDIPEVWITMTYTLAAGDEHVRVDVQVRNDGDETLVILCCCAPAYTHDDTELL